MRKGDIQTPFDFHSFLNRECKYNKTAKYYERILRRHIVPKILSDYGKLLWDTTSVEETYNIWKETTEKSQKAALSFFLQYVKEQNGLKKWTLDYYQHKKIWKLETSQLLSQFKKYLSRKKCFLVDFDARDECVKKLLHILEIENISLPELAKNIETTIIYYLPGGKQSRIIGTRL